jgi:hypothetical protein
LKNNPLSFNQNPLLSNHDQPLTQSFNQNSPQFTHQPYFYSNCLFNQNPQNLPFNPNPQPWSTQQYYESYGEETPMPQVRTQPSLSNSHNLESTLMAFMQKIDPYIEEYQSTLNIREASIRDLKTQLSEMSKQLSERPQVMFQVTPW